MHAHEADCTLRFLVAAPEMHAHEADCTLRFLVALRAE